MSLASSSNVTLYGIEESVFGQTPTTGNPFTLRIVGDTLDYSISKESSKEINSNRTTASAIPVSASVTGGVNAEMSFATYDALLRSAMQGAWASHGTGGVSSAPVTVDATAITLTASVATSGADNWANLQRGQWFSLQGVGPNGGKILRVSPTVAPTSTVITLDTNTPATVSAAEVVSLTTSRLTHGKLQTSFSFERVNEDIGVHTVFRGCTPSKYDLNVASGQLTSLNFEFMGKDAEADTATFLPGSATAPTAYEVHSGVFGATTAVWMDGAPAAGTYVKSVALSYDNVLRAQDAIGHLGAVGIGSGTIAATLTASIYFADKSLFDKYVKNQNTSFVFATSDAAGNGYIFSAANVNITSFKSNPSAKDQDQMAEITFTLLEDRGNPVEALRKVLFIDRIGDALV